LHSVTTRLAYLSVRSTAPLDVLPQQLPCRFSSSALGELPALGGDAELFTELRRTLCGRLTAAEPEHADELYYRARAGDSATLLALAPG